MAKTVKRMRSTNKSRKNVNSRSQRNQTDQQTIILKFLAIMNMIRLFHWKTHSFSTHKATDEVFSQLHRLKRKMRQNKYIIQKRT